MKQTEEHILQRIREHDLNCIGFGWNYYGAHGNTYGNHHDIKKNALLSGEIINNSILPPLLNLRDDKQHFVFDYVWNKLFKAEMLRERGMHFGEEKRTWEDSAFLLRHLKQCDSDYSMECSWYNYVWILNSLSQQY